MGRVSIVAALAGLLASVLVLAQVASAAAPRYILVSGPCLTKPVLLDSWEENHQLYSSLVGAPRIRGGMRSPRGRPRLDLAVFWTLPEPGPPTRPRDATYHDWFYPAHQGRPAVVDALIHGVREPRRASPLPLSILKRHGVTIRSADCARTRRAAS